MIITVSLVNITCSYRFFFVMRNFKIYSLNFQICNTVLLTVYTRLNIISPCPILYLKVCIFLLPSPIPLTPTPFTFRW